MKPTFTGEIQLAGWSESHNGGCKVTFWLQSPDELEAFRALTVRKGNTAGHRFMAALVEIGDDEQPVQKIDTSPERVQKMAKNELGPLAYWLVLRCGEPEFQNWIWSNYSYLPGKSSEKHCADTVKILCEVKSRKDIDGNPEATRLMNLHIRGPYMKHLAARCLA